MDLSGRNADLSAESVAEAVREAGRNIPVYSCGIHHLHEICRSFIIFCQDRIRVMRAEAVDMLTGFLHIRDQLNGNNKLQILGRKIILPHDLTGNKFRDLLRSADLNARGIQRGLHLREEFTGDLSVDKQCLDRVAGSRVLAFCVDDHRDRLLKITVLIHINMADPVSVSHDRNLRIVHDIADKAVRPARDQKIHIPVAAQKLIDLIVELSLKKAALRQTGFRHALMNDGEEFPVGLSGLLSALQDRAVPALDTEGGNLDQGIRSRLEDDADDTDRAAHTLHDKIRIHLPHDLDFPDRIRQGCQLMETFDD